MFRLILPASQIPDDQLVCKPTGRKRYQLKSSLPLYTNGELVGFPHQLQSLIDSTNLELKFLVSESGIQMISQETELAVDFETARDLEFFVQRLEEYPCEY